MTTSPSSIEAMQRLATRGASWCSGGAPALWLLPLLGVLLALRVFLPALVPSLLFLGVLAAVGFNLACFCLRLAGQVWQARAGRSRPAALLAFHAGLLLCGAGGVATWMGRFDGYIELGVGQAFRHGQDPYLKREQGRFYRDGAAFELRLREVQAFTRYRRDGEHYSSLVELIDARDGRTEERRLPRGRPVSFGGYDVHQSRFYGPALFFDYVGADGCSVAGFVNLPLPEPGDAPAPEHRFDVPATSLKATVRLDARGASPDLHLTIHDGERQVYRGPFREGQAIACADGRLRLLSVTRWTGLQVVHDPGLPFFYLGCLGVGAGLLGLFAGGWRPVGA